MMLEAKQRAEENAKSIVEKRALEKAQREREERERAEKAAAQARAMASEGLAPISSTTAMSYVFLMFSR